MSEVEDSKLLRKLVVFSILMENNEGILEKSPSYILEKFYTAMGLKEPEQLLDFSNRDKLEEWYRKWGKQG